MVDGKLGGADSSLVGVGSAVVPVASEEERPSDGEEEEDVGIIFIARKAETPKQRPKSGKPRPLRGRQRGTVTDGQQYE